ncbi:hypothetical protein WJU16_00640 [Chitinophaga pollutisoli]|uniref:Uncharacterized protein n=1 Tax=Chitinophaga pollutisoli TaxID=3133966 RepID=A0ABZ2YQ32_9BACT
MTESPQNRLSASMAEKDLQSVKKSLAELTKSMPFLIGLNALEKKRLTKINTSNKVFVEDIIKTFDLNKSIIPNFISQDEIAKDLTLFHQLDEIEFQLSEILEKVRCTRKLAGSEAYGAALMIYQLIKTATKAGVPGAAASFELLKDRFSASTGRPKKENPAPVQQDQL